MLTSDIKLDKIFQVVLEETDREQHEIQVIELLKYYLQHRPEHGRAWLTYGESLRLVGRYEEAMEALLKSLELAPQEKKPLICGRIGFLCTLSRSPMEAETWYKLASQSKHCSKGWVWLLRGVNVMKLGKYEDARYCMNRALEFGDVDRSEVFLNNGLILRAMEKYEEAKSAFQTALEEDENYQEARKCLEGLNELSKIFELINTDG